jgi:hypothetical protein
MITPLVGPPSGGCYATVANLALAMVETIPHLIPAMYVYLERTMWNAIDPNTSPRLLQPTPIKQNAHQRQREGIARAKAEGRYKGRQPTARNQSGQVLALAGEGLTRTAIAERLGIGVASVYRILAEAKPG